MKKARIVPGFFCVWCELHELDFQALAHAFGDAL